MENTTYVLRDGTILKSWDDWGLRKTERTKISPPVRRQNRKAIPGVNGTTDLMPYMNEIPTYDDRTLTDTFVYVKKQRKWEDLKSDIYSALDGGKCRIILDRDPWYYWEGETAVKDVSDGRDVLQLQISATVFPYKYERFSSVEKWFWSPFNFHNGVIREYAGLEVDGSRTLVIPCLDLPVIPGFWTSDTGMSVTYGGVTGNLTQRAAAQDPKVYEQFPEILLTKGERTLTLSGTGTVDVFYRGGRL